VISALNISRDYRYAEITEIRRDRREDFKSRQGLLFVQSQLNSKLKKAAMGRPRLPAAAPTVHFSRIPKLNI
jgi:hypothetical protein